MPAPAKQQVTRGLVPPCHVVVSIQPRNRHQDCYLENPLVPPMVHIHATILSGRGGGRAHADCFLLAKMSRKVPSAQLLGDSTQFRADCLALVTGFGDCEILALISTTEHGHDDGPAHGPGRRHAPALEIVRNTIRSGSYASRGGNPIIPRYLSIELSIPATCLRHTGEIRVVDPDLIVRG